MLDQNCEVSNRVLKDLHRNTVAGILVFSHEHPSINISNDLFLGVRKISIFAFTISQDITLKPVKAQ
jgi:hypothetical protein